MMSAKRVRLPWISQRDSQSASPMDCGQACVLMLARKWGYAEAGLTVDALYRRAPAPGGTVYGDLQRLAAGIRSTRGGRDFVLSAGPNPTAAILRGYVDQGYPPILLVNYESLEIPRPDLVNGSRQGLHWLIVSGYDDDDFLVHDPLWQPDAREGQGGAYLPVKDAALIGALRGVNLHHWMAVDTATRRALGFHVSGPHRTGYGALLEAGLAYVKAVGERGALLEAKQIDPTCVTAFRDRTQGDTPQAMYVGDPTEAARAWMDRLLPVWFAGPVTGIDYFELTNEASPPNVAAMKWFADFNVAAMDVAEGWGIALGVGSFSAGNPPLDADYLEAMLPMVQRAGQKHPFCLHGYPILGNGAIYEDVNRACLYRFAPLWAFFQARGCSPTIDLTEAGVYYGNHKAFHADDSPDPAWIVQAIQDFDLEMRSYPYVRAYALFDLGAPPGHEWWGANHVDVVPQLAAYLREQNA